MQSPKYGAANRRYMVCITNSVLVALGILYCARRRDDNLVVAMRNIIVFNSQFNLVTVNSLASLFPFAGQ
jgi:hypothetical protein